MDACRRVVAVLIVLMWAIGAVPSRADCGKDDRASLGDSVGVLGCRRQEWARALAETRDEPNEVSADIPPVVPSSGITTCVAGSMVVSLVDPHGCRTRWVASGPRGPPTPV